jgi:hypothetical protein
MVNSKCKADFALAVYLADARLSGGHFFQTRLEQQ